MSEMEKRQAWKESAILLAKKGDYASALQVLANNVGNRGNVIEFIEDVCENSDPWFMN